jgi:TPR repeat protein
MAQPAPAKPDLSGAGTTPAETAKASNRAHPLALASDTQTSAPAADGTQELMLGQRYLSQHDTTLAAQWLWKAVSKQNGRAAMLLADLYAHGEGVPQSCDQARILLRAAARKGISGAGMRLQNLEVSGCR